VLLTGMSELRVALLIAGGVFLAVLTWWELRRSQRTARGTHEPVLRELQDLPLLPRGWGELPATDDDEPGSLLPPSLQSAYMSASRTAAATAPAPADVTPRSVPAGASREPIVEWPPDGQRQIISLRLVAVLPGQFAGHALRQALLAEGFVLGKFSIFHRPDAQGRASLSAASLTQPGSFDDLGMDSQRFPGLSLFAVLPGPKAPLESFDELLSVARGLNTRLEGALQDEQGQPLTPLRVAALRRGMPADRTA